jgi:A/G-specific adenine glycosylase
MWEGLGYYSRARNLHRAARLVVEKHGGRFPETLEEAAALPGLGRSTAGAILSIGYSRKTPVLDANVKRVLCRVFAVEDAGSPREIERKLWRIAGDLVRCRRPGDLNQGLMEVGSQVCAPRSPRCGSCPLKRRCGAFRSGDPELYALPVRRPRTERFRVALGIVFKGDKVLIQRRPEKGLLGGLWEFPGGKVEPGERVEQALHRELREELGVEVRILKTRETLEHHYTRFRVTLHPFDCGIVSGRPLLGGTNRRRWCPVSRLAAYAFPAANRRLILRLLSERGG